MITALADLGGDERSRSHPSSCERIRSNAKTAPGSHKLPRLDDLRSSCASVLLCAMKNALNIAALADLGGMSAADHIREAASASDRTPGRRQDLTSCHAWKISGAAASNENVLTMYVCEIIKATTMFLYDLLYFSIIYYYFVLFCMIVCFCFLFRVYSRYIHYVFYLLTLRLFQRIN